MKLKVPARRSNSWPGWVYGSTQGDFRDHDYNAEDDDDDDLVKVFLDQDGCAVALGEVTERPCLLPLLPLLPS